jgi:hypothetical protein
MNEFSMEYFSQWMSIYRLIAALADIIHSVLRIRCSMEHKWNLCDLEVDQCQMAFAGGSGRKTPVLPYSYRHTTT